MRDDQKNLIWIEDLKAIDRCQKFMDIEQTEKMVADCVKNWNAIKNSLNAYKRNKSIKVDPGAADKYVEFLDGFCNQTKEVMVRNSPH